MKIFLIFSTLLISLNSFASKFAVQGEIISTNKMNASLSQLGDIKQSLLSTVKFQSIHGDCWVKMEGQNITGSDLANLEPISSTLPNSTGRFLIKRQRNPTHHLCGWDELTNNF